VAPGLAAACAIFADDDPADMDVLAAFSRAFSFGRVRARAPSLVPSLASCEEILACEEKFSRLEGGLITFHSATNDVLHYMPKLSSLL
jgi:hypothetical protein